MAESAAQSSSLERPSQGEEHFRWRGGGVSRIEGLSDGVFALALTLLVVKLEVPRDFDDLVLAFKQVPVFLLTYAMFGWVWYLHHRFHRRFGLEDVVTVSWNLVLLFVVLLYVYPLRYLAGALCQMFGIVETVPALGPGEVASGLMRSDMQTLMILYGAGYVALFGVLTMLHRHAWRMRDALGLDARERVLTRSAFLEMKLSAGVGLVSIAIACIGDQGLWQMLAGVTYSLSGPLYGWSGRRMQREIAALDAAAPATDAGASPPA